MDLAVAPPINPMLARSATFLPRGHGWLYEPKWDGFRALLFRCGGDVYVSSRNGRPLQDRFPELVPAALDRLPERCVIDGEIVATTADGLDFEALLRRFDGRRGDASILIAFDLLSVGDRDLREDPFQRRRALLEASVQEDHRLRVTPQTDDLDVAREWLQEWSAPGLEGVVAKRASAPYRSGRRTMVKVKSVETSDFVVGGYRGTPGEPAYLLLGAYDGDGSLRHIGQTTVLPEERRPEIAAALAALQGGPGFGRGVPGLRRWNGHRPDEWWSVAPELVCEVAFTRMDAGGLLRHGARFLRWRPDKLPRECVLPPRARARGPRPGR
jgi:ATP-dependent DNA ligase